jgi:DNA polymerase-4
MDVLRSLGHPVEVWGWDEAVLGCSVGDPEAFAADVRAAVARETGLTCAVGIGETKERAKMATAFAKASPERVYRLDSANWMEVMGGRDVAELWGVGSRTAARLAEHEVRTVAQLAVADPADLASWFGPTTGPRLRVLARGGASRTVSTDEWVPRSRSKQVTYPRDLTDPAEIADQVAILARDVSREVFAEGRAATHVSVVVRTSTFYTRTKTGKLAEPTTQPDVVAARAREVLSRFDITRPVRLLGVRVLLA